MDPYQFLAISSIPGSLGFAIVFDAGRGRVAVAATTFYISEGCNKLRERARGDSWEHSGVGLRGRASRDTRATMRRSCAPMGKIAMDVLGAEAGRFLSYANPADYPNFVSVPERPPTLLSAWKKCHGPGLIILAAIPILAFALGCWQVQRLTLKTDMKTKFSEQLTRPPLPLPPHMDTAQIPSFEYPRITASGTPRHDQEILIDLLIKDGENGYQIVAQLERPNRSKILVNRGWIRKDKREHRFRGEGALPKEGLEIEALLRAPWKNNSFTSDNRPNIGKFYFPDVEGMPKLVGDQPVWVEETM
ncbi:surf-like protein, partial [Rhizina undulata]